MATQTEPDDSYRRTNEKIGEWFDDEIQLRDEIVVTATELARTLDRPVYEVKQVLDDLSDDVRVPIERDEHRYRVEV